MPLTQQTAEQTLNDICQWRPALSQILQAFVPVFRAQEALSADMREEAERRSLRLPAPSAEHLSLGLSLLAETELPDLTSVYARSRTALLPALAGIPALAGEMDTLMNLVGSLSREDQASLLSVVTTNSPSLGQDVAKRFGLSELTVALVANLLVSPILHGLVAASFGASSDPSAVMPWDANNAWQQGYCPVCGSAPIIAWLDTAVSDERNPYLLEGGGRKHLHCGVCGANWRFLRLSCPACGIQKSKELEILSEESRITHGERLDWCPTCKAYCPTVDLRERTAFPQLEAQAMGMLHLELVAAERGLKPLRASFWNTFS